MPIECICNKITLPAYLGHLLQLSPPEAIVTFINLPMHQICAAYPGDHSCWSQTIVLPMLLDPTHTPCDVLIQREADPQNKSAPKYCLS